MLKVDLTASLRVMKHHRHEKLAYGNRLINTGFSPIGTKAEFAVQASRRMRRNPTAAEEALRISLESELPHVFDFQYPAGEFIADFYSEIHRIAIEVDGSSHDLPSIKVRDLIKTDHLESDRGMVLRFTNEQVLDDLPAVMRAIKGAIADLDQSILQSRINRMVKKGNPCVILYTAPTDGTRYTKDQMYAFKRMYGKYRQRDMERLGIKWPPPRGWLQRYLEGKDPNTA